MSESFWLDAPREHFAERCMRQFGVTFDAAVYKVTSETVPVKRSKKAAPIYASAYDALSGYSAGHRGNAKQMSMRAMKKTSLIGGS